jgi:hypothetical protein
LLSNSNEKHNLKRHLLKTYTQNPIMLNYVEVVSNDTMAIGLMPNHKPYKFKKTKIACINMSHTNKHGRYN